MSEHKISIATEIKEVPIEMVLAMRQRVMYPNKTLESLKLANDAEGFHYGLLIDNQLISVISLFYDKQELQFRKFATETNFQGKGYGTALLQYVFEDAQKRNSKTIWCNARVSAIGIYERFGMKTASEQWKSEDIEYVKMSVTF